MISQLTLSAMSKNISDADKFLKSNYKEETGSMDAIDFALCSIAASLQVLTSLFCRQDSYDRLLIDEEATDATWNTES